LVKAVEGDWQSSGIFTYQPVAGKTRNDTSTDNHDQHDSTTHRQPLCVITEAEESDLDVENQVGEQEYDDGNNDCEIAPVSPDDNLLGRRGSDSGKEGTVQNSG